MPLYTDDTRDKKGACKARSQGRHRRINANLQKPISYSDLAQPERLVNRGAADQTPRTNLKRGRRFKRSNVEEDDMIVVREVLPKHLRNKLVLMTRSTATENEITSSAGNEEKDEEADHPKVERHFNDGKRPLCLVGQRIKCCTTRTFHLSA